jgi:hypothetical protein
MAVANPIDHPEAAAIVLLICKADGEIISTSYAARRFADEENAVSLTALRHFAFSARSCRMLCNAGGFTISQRSLAGAFRFYVIDA